MGRQGATQCPHSTEPRIATRTVPQCPVPTDRLAPCVHLRWGMLPTLDTVPESTQLLHRTDVVRLAWVRHPVARIISAFFDQAIFLDHGRYRNGAMEPHTVPTRPLCPVPSANRPAHALCRHCVRVRVRQVR